MAPIDSSTNRQISIINMVDEDSPQSPRIYFLDMPAAESSQGEAAPDAVSTPPLTGRPSTVSSGIPSQPATAVKPAMMASIACSPLSTIARKSSVVLSEDREPLTTPGKLPTAVSRSINPSPPTDRSCTLLERVSIPSPHIEKPPALVGGFNDLTRTVEKPSSVARGVDNPSQPMDRSPAGLNMVRIPSLPTEKPPILGGRLDYPPTPAEQTSSVEAGLSHPSALTEKQSTAVNQVSNPSQPTERPPPVSSGAVTPQQPPVRSSAAISGTNKLVSGGFVISASSVLTNVISGVEDPGLPITLTRVGRSANGEAASPNPDSPLQYSGRKTAVKDLDEGKQSSKIAKITKPETNASLGSMKDVNDKGEQVTREKKKTTPEGEEMKSKSTDTDKSNPTSGQKEIVAQFQGKEEGETGPLEESTIQTNPTLDVNGHLENSTTAKPASPTNREWHASGYMAEKGLDLCEKHASKLTPDEWDEILENCGVMYGWCIDRTKKRIIRAPKPAFRLKRLPHPKQPLNPSLEKEESGKTVDDIEHAQESPRNEEILAQVLVDSKPKPAKIKPTFIVNDNSRIDIMVSTDEFETSMATNDFSSQCTEGFVSGAIVSSSATAGTSSLGSSVPNQYNKVMIAKFLFPKVDVSLHPSHLEPTPELEEALKNVKDKKNICDLRRLHSDFGYLFCNRVTLGGRLQTLKIMNHKSQKSEQEQMQSFKASVGLAVSSHYGGASSSNTREGGYTPSSVQSDTGQNEHHVFEAVGGDTLLASNSTDWVRTVGKLKNWQAIDRDGLTIMVDAIAGLSEYDHVKTWHGKAALPKLKKYIEFAGTTEKQIRLRLLSPNHGLCFSHLRDDPNYNSPVPPRYYLGHRPYWAAMPRAMAVDFDDQWNKLISRGERDFLFSPASYRAPAIYGYASNKAGSSDYGTRYDEELSTTVWNIFAVQDEALCNQSQVTIRIPPKPAVEKIQHETTPRKEEDFEVPDEAHPETSLMVFRNQQGVFLPAMSDTEEIQIWRILKKGANPNSRENIKEGDEIRLAWCFEDQNVGYRDFTDDVFGRRRTGPPPGIENTALYMKLPWPRFEPIAKQSDQKKPSPNALVMSAVPDDFSTWPPPIEEISTISSQTVNPNNKAFYYLEDCSFRLDFVGNQGRSEVQDYLLQAVA